MFAMHSVSTGLQQESILNPWLVELGGPVVLTKMLSQNYGRSPSVIGSQARALDDDQSVTNQPVKTRTRVCMSHPMTHISDIITLYSCDCHITLLVYIVVLVCANNITSLVLSHHLHPQTTNQPHQPFPLPSP